MREGSLKSGFVAADAILSFVDEQSASSSDESKPKPKPKLPRIHGLITFDTPFMGIASPMLAYSAFSNFSRVSSAYRLMSMLPATFLGAKAGVGDPRALNRRTPLELAAVPAWRTIAAYAGTTGALAAAGIAAYMNREELYQGYTWLTNHLQFIGVIMKREESRLRLARIAALEGFGFANLYVSLGQNSVMTGGSYVPERTFCATPPATNPLAQTFRKETNIVAKDEIDAHMSMFLEQKNPGYSRVLEDAKTLVVEWAQRDFSGYRTLNLAQKTSEAMVPSADEESAATQELQVAVNVPLPDVDADEAEATAPTQSSTEETEKEKGTDKEKESETGKEKDTEKEKETSDQAPSSAQTAESNNPSEQLVETKKSASTS